MKYKTNQAVQRIINKIISETQNTNSKWHTLHNSIRRFYRRKISDNSDVIIPVGALNVNVDGFSISLCRLVTIPVGYVTLVSLPSLSYLKIH